MPNRTFETPREDDLGLRRIASGSGLGIALLPNGCLFSIEHESPRGKILINQVQGSPLDGGIGRVLLRTGSDAPEAVTEAAGPGARAGVAVAGDRAIWAGEAAGLRHRVALWLHPEHTFWIWRVEVENTGATPIRCDATLVQDIGLGGRNFVMNNEAYVSQYIDHHVARHPTCGRVVMSRQNLAQAGAHPWLAHGCVEGAAGYGTDASQIMGPDYRDRGSIDGTAPLPGERLQHEAACPTIRSETAAIEPGAKAVWTFFAHYEPDHPEASGDADLARVDALLAALDAFEPSTAEVSPPVRSLLQDAPVIAGLPLDAAALDARYPKRLHEEHADGRLQSFFAGEGAASRHVVLREKETALVRRHGAILRTGQGMLVDDTTMCSTVWMHGVFASLLSLGNTSFQRVFSASRDPYNIVRSGGLRILAEVDGGWRLLAEPSVFEIGLSDCRWVYALDGRTVTVRTVASGEEPAMRWRIEVDGAPCRFLVFGRLVMGERELDRAGRVEIDPDARRITLTPDPASAWAEYYPEAAFHLVTATPEAVEAIGGDELLHADGVARGGGFLALRTAPAASFDFTLVGALADPARAGALAQRYGGDPDTKADLAASHRYWSHVTRDLTLEGGDAVAALGAMLPWLAQNAMIHLTVPHGLEQSGGAAWGTRDVCQGPVEFLLALEHDDTVRQILATVFAQQFEAGGDWPQWFMLEPYANIRDRHSHGDVIVWPLKALCDYIEATDDVGILAEPVAWRREADLAPTERRDPISAHVEKLLATVRDRFIPGTHLIRYGEGDWNDSLQPADPKLRDWMASSWTVSLLFQQLSRYAAVLARAGRTDEADDLEALAAAIREDFNRHLVRDGTVAGYAIFEPGRDEPELLLHPADRRTGLAYSLLPMTRSIIGGLFTPEQARHHLGLIREHLLFSDGVRLMDRPVVYRGGPEQIFRRAESAAFFGREIGLMYVHAHLRYGEAMSVLGEAEALWDALEAVNPVTVAEGVANASPRQRNAYFSSSDAAFPDRYRSSADWDDLRAGTVPVDGGWRIYSSGPGLYTNLLVCLALGVRRRWGQRVVSPVLPGSLWPVVLSWRIGGRQQRIMLSGE